MPRGRTRTTTRSTTTRRSRQDDVITVKVGRIGDTVKEVLLSRGASVLDALEAAGVESGEGQRLRFKGEPVNTEDSLDSDGVLTIAGQIKGGFH